MNSPKSRVTLADIAAELRLSKTAVSYALRNHRNASKETRIAVQEVAKRLGYQPDPTISKLMLHLHGEKHQTAGSTLAFLNVSERKNFNHTTPALRNFFQGAQEQAKLQGYQSEEFWLGDPQCSPSRLAQILQARGIQGLLVGSTGHANSHIDFPWEKFSAVTVGYSLKTPQLNRVVTHHYENTVEAIQNIHAAGYTRIGLLVDPIMEPTMKYLHIAALSTRAWAISTLKIIPPCSGLSTFPTWLKDHQPEIILNATPHKRDILTTQGLSRNIPLVSLLSSEKVPKQSGIYLRYDKLGRMAIKQLAEQLLHDEMGIPEDQRTTMIQGTWYDEGLKTNYSDTNK